MSGTPADRTLGVAELRDRSPERPHLVEPLLSASEIAELLSVHPSTIRRLAREGRLPTYWVGTTPRFDADEVAEVLRQDVRESRPAHRHASTEPQPSRGRTSRLDRDGLRTSLYG